MAFDFDGKLKQSNFAALLSRAGVYGLKPKDARERIDGIVSSVRESCAKASYIGELSNTNWDHLWGLQILIPAAFYNY